MRAPNATRLLALTTAICTTMPVLAQQAAPAMVTLEEIVVTATKRSENLQDVPVAVSALSATDLAAQGVFETADLNAKMPNLQVSSAYGAQQPNFSLRGIGVGTEYNANAASPVGVYVDEVYQTFRSSHGQQLYDLEQIEVVRGPQGTLFGRNTTGGAISFNTRKPALIGSNGYVTAGYGRFNRVNLEGAVEATPVDDKLGLRLAGTYVNSDPYMRNRLAAGLNKSSANLPDAAAHGNRATGVDPGGPESYGLRGTVRLVPTETLDITLKGYAGKTKGGQEVAISTGPSLTDDTVSLITTPLGGLYGSPLAPLLPPAYSRDGRGLSDREVETDSNGTAISRAEGAVLNIKAELGDALNLTSISGFDSGHYAQTPNTDCDGTPARGCSIGYDSTFKAFNQDLRLDYAADRFKIILGAYYGWDEMKTHNQPDFYNFLSDIRKAAGLPATYFNPGGAFNGTLLPIDALPTGIRGTQDFVQTRKSYALYSEASYELTDTVKLTAGARYTWDKFAYTDALSIFHDDTGAPRLVTVSGYAPGGVEQPFIIGASPGAYTPLERRADSAKPTGRVVLDWKLDEDVMLYGSASRGYRGGTYNGLSYQASAQVYFVPPETVDAFEIGIKSRFLDNRLQVNAAVFFYDYKGQQGQIVDQSATANLISLDGSLKGLEAEIDYVASDSLRLNAGLGMLDSEYDDGNCPTAILAGFLPQQGNCLRSGAGNVDIGGNPFPYAAKWSATVGFDWDALELDEGKFTLHGDASYTGRFYYDSFGAYDYVSANGAVNSRNLAKGVFHKGEGDYVLVNARLTYATDRYSIAAWVKNLTDKVYYPFGINLEGNFGSDYRIRSAPRTFGLEATYRF